MIHSARVDFWCCSTSKKNLHTHVDVRKPTTVARVDGDVSGINTTIADIASNHYLASSLMISSLRSRTLYLASISNSLRNAAIQP
jgi:hypothetical protein